jgi:drug/metabolite transporter (DMT)-like permease
VGLAFLPFLLAHMPQFGIRWWALAAAAGVAESLSLAFSVRGYSEDYYSTYAVSNTNPVLVVLLGWALLGERMDWGLGLGVALAAAGSLVLFFRGHVNRWGLGAAAAVALSKVASKAGLSDGSALAQASAAFLSGGLVLAAVDRFRGPGLNPGPLLRELWPRRLFIVGSALTTACAFEAMALGPAGGVALLSRSNLLVGFLLSYYGLDERRDWRGRALGAALILLGLALAAWRI